MKNYANKLSKKVCNCGIAELSDEYSGVRLAARRGGHIQNALHFEWSTALNRQNHLKLHPLERTRQRLEQLGFDLKQPVVVYCQSSPFWFGLYSG